MDKTNSEAFEASVSSGEPMLAYFSAAWCGPCRSFKPRMEAIAEKYAEVDVLLVDVDAEPSIAEKFGVMSVPTVIGIKNSSEVSRMVGARTQAEVDNFVTELIGEDNGS